MTSKEPSSAHVPPLLYGTAWKEDRTESLVRKAIQLGFRGIDTANQRKHYHEEGVGAAVQGALKAGEASRGELFVQTKFTFLDGQDHRLPYDAEAPVALQVEQSMSSSLQHLGLDFVDSLVLHGPSSRVGLQADDWAAWHAMEDVQRSGKARLLGISNVKADQLEALHEQASVKPAFVQNRTLVYPQRDAATRTFCRRHGITYQGFSLLTAAPELLRHPAVLGPAARLGATPAQVVLGFWQSKDVIVLTGTTSPKHMEEDLAILKLGLEAHETQAIAGALGLAEAL